MAARPRGTGNLMAAVASLSGLCALPTGLVSFVTLFAPSAYANPVVTLGLGVTAITLAVPATAAGAVGIVWARLWYGFGRRSARVGMVCGTSSIAVAVYSIAMVLQYYARP